MKRIMLLGMVLLLMICVLLSACSTNSTPTEAQTEALTEAPTEAPTEPEIDFSKSISNCRKVYGTYGYAEEKKWNDGIFDKFSISSDGRSMSIACENSWSSTMEQVFTAVRYMNIELGFGEALNNKMSMTRAIDGMQSDENDKIKVSWNYHPDSGLSVIYEKK